ncbi:hypothetical protein QYF50_06525 [Paenibacillus vini]|uniref:hypothetical protein n=1 Tax=Paenibacillus vini TaxID=1476024 RepID=UPI0025B649D6|nr:hypothetical protein [Paenibacillus vini]MDN4067546.1 hypothetical protein [Paenibacillus vini]
MKTQMIDRLFGDVYVMLNFEITFDGVQSWFQMAGINMDVPTLFKSLLLPENLTDEEQALILRTVLYRYEDVFFQTNRAQFTDSDNTDSAIHQLLLRMMNQRTLYGENDALLDLYLNLQEDKQREEPVYVDLHGIFNSKWV